MVGQMICCLLLRRANLDTRKPEILTDIALVGHRKVYDFYFAPNSKDCFIALLTIRIKPRLVIFDASNVSVYPP